MTREIKFRAWDANKKLMVNSGVVLYDGKAYLSYRDFEDAIQSGNYLMQFTGLKDKNEKEIYEGDILGDCDVYWYDKIATFELRGSSLRLWAAARTEEVIGNIYENPSLLQ
ncbi:MAG TPA: YopX family protein [Edaphobacter sp.]|nr:YopX family protein [Edaphobacter sp.]